MSDETSSKLEKIIATLGEKLELTGIEIAEILWLAQQNQTTIIEETPNTNLETIEPLVTEGSEETEESLETVETKPENLKPFPENTTPYTPTTPVDIPQPAESKAEIFPKTNHSTSNSGDNLDIKVPDAPGLREPLKLARAIRPLIQKIDSDTEVILDEEATANHIARDGIRIAVFQPAKEPAFDLMLVVEESSTMIFWRKAIQELQQLFQVLGAFRDVQVWGLVTNNEKIYLRRGMGKKARKNRYYQPRSLVDPSGKRLILVASDCVSHIWHNGKAFEMLNIWAKTNTVAIIQMLPQWLWQRTGLSLGAKVQFSSLNPRIANQDLLIKKILLWDDIDFATGIKIPIFTLEEESAKTWSKMIAGRSDAHVTGFVFSSNLEDLIAFTVPEEDSLISETQEIETEEITSNFRRTASPMARKLASLLSAAPVINLPVVRIIQAQMLKESQQVHVAEVFLGGIIKRKQEIEITPETNPDDIEFDFLNEDVRKSLLDAAPVTDSLEIIEVISKYFAKKLGKTLSEFNALLRKPQLIDDESKDEIKPFALLSAKVLKRLGGNYVQFAEEMEQRWDNRTFEDEENHLKLRTGKIYALLVGIDKYAPESGVSSLKGCVNDIEAIEKYLNIAIKNENKNKGELVTQKLTNELATRQGIIDGFMQHLSQATSEDAVLFYYAGHGSYETAPENFRNFKVEPRGNKIQTIVCHDSRTSGVPDLEDEELIYLIEQVAKNNPHILIILDCPHSGFGVKNTKIVEHNKNSNPEKRDNIDLQDFLFSQEWLNYRSSKSYKPPRHVALAACRDFQNAKEYTGSDGKRRGAFSYYLTEVLQRTNGNLSYANLVKDVNALVSGKFKNQSPEIKARPEDLIKTFLGGAVAERINYFTLTYDQRTHRNWVINGGILHGIRPISEGNTLLAIFLQGTTLEELQEIGNAICQARITEVYMGASTVEIIGDTSKLSEDIPYWAIVTDVPSPKLKVYFRGEANGVQLARRELSKVSYTQPFLFVGETKSLTDANYYLEAVNGQFWIKQPSDEKPLIAPIPQISDAQGYSQQSANQIIKRLEHIARWQNVLDLKTPPDSQIQAGDVEMEVIMTSGSKKYSSKTETNAIRAEYTGNEIISKPPIINIKVTNQSNKEVYFQILELTENYAINIVPFSQIRNSILLHSTVLIEGEKFSAQIPRIYLNNGTSEYDMIFKLIVSTKEFNVSSLEQPGLDFPPPLNFSSKV